MHDALIEQTREGLGRRGGALNIHAVADLTKGLHPSDLAVILDELTLPEAERVFALIDEERAAEALSQVAAATSRHLIEASPTAHILALLRRLPADEVAEVVAHAGEKGRSLLALLPTAAARDVEHLLEYPEQTAGRLMSTKCATVRPDMTVAHAFGELRRMAPAVETIVIVYVVDGAGLLVGVSLTVALVAGSVLGLVAVAWSGHVPFGLVVGVAMTCAIVTAGFMGTVIPMLSKRLGFDPAATAGPFETAFQDVIGFTVFLWLAAALAKWLV